MQGLPPAILILSEDLFLLAHLENSCRQMGYTPMRVDSPDAIGAQGPAPERPIPLTEPLEGPDAIFIRHVVEIQPALILVDIAAEQLPWERWIHTIKTSAATRRIPILAYGPHVEREKLELARAAGAEAALPRGQLMRSLPQEIKSRARSIDALAMNSACQGELSEPGKRGVQLLNAGVYFEAHEQLEAAWMQAPAEQGHLYRVLLQVAVAYLHVEKGNLAGARKMLLRLRQWLAPLPGRCRGVDIQALRENLELFQQALDAQASSQIAAIDPALLKPIPLA